MQHILAVAVGASPEQGASGVLRRIIEGKRVGQVRPYVAGLINGLKNLGLRPGQDFEIDYATCEPKGLRTQVKTAIDEERPDAIFAMSTSAVKAAMAASKDIPIVFPSISHPEDDGVVKSCAVPGKNATGVRAMRQQSADECLELFKATVPSLRTVFGLHKPRYGPAIRAMGGLKRAARRARVSFKSVEVRSQKEIADRLSAMSQTGAAGKPELGVLVLPDDLVLSATPQIIKLAEAKRLPTFFPATDWVRPDLPSALAGFGVPQAVCGEAAAPYMHKVLSGVPPRDLPVKRIGGFDWAVSKAAAAAIGITLPASVIKAADRVI